MRILDQAFLALGKTADLKQTIDTFLAEWEKTLPANGYDPKSQDRDKYVEPVSFLGNHLQILKEYSLRKRLFLEAARIADEYSRGKGVPLHQGAIYAQLAISCFELGEYRQGLYSLHAAVDQDKKNYGIQKFTDSYAFNIEKGIFTQWLRGAILPILPTSLSIPTSKTGGLEFQDLLNFCMWSMGFGDVGFFSGIVEFHEATGHKNFHASATRFGCLRDLAGLFEAVLKAIGFTHKDSAVINNFSRKDRNLAKILCFMHYRGGSTSANDLGIFYKSAKTVGYDPVLQNLKPLFDQYPSSIPDDQVWSALSSTLPSASNEEAMAKIFFMAYKLRNRTSHDFNPEDTFLLNNYDALFALLIQANISAFLWAENSGEFDLWKNVKS